MMTELNSGRTFAGMVKKNLRSFLFYFIFFKRDKEEYLESLWGNGQTLVESSLPFFSFVSLGFGHYQICGPFTHESFRRRCKEDGR